MTTSPGVSSSSVASTIDPRITPPSFAMRNARNVDMNSALYLALTSYDSVRDHTRRSATHRRRAARSGRVLGARGGGVAVVPDMGSRVRVDLPHLPLVHRRADESRLQRARSPCRQRTR